MGELKSPSRTNATEIDGLLYTPEVEGSYAGFYGDRRKNHRLPQELDAESERNMTSHPVELPAPVAVNEKGGVGVGNRGNEGEEIVRSGSQKYVERR